MLPNCNGLGIEAGPFALPEGGHYAMEVRNMSRGNGVSELENALLMEPSDFQATYFAEKPKPEEENLVFFCQIGSDDCHVMQTARELEYLGANYEDAYRAWQAKED
uniref:Thiosulfate sulfurtransferase like domain containing 1 n=1 Tax=Monodelphis domestica TaxID=13616 RepID=A0A5F8H4H1_MONDO